MSESNGLDYFDLMRAITYAHVQHEGKTILQLEDSVIRAEQRANELLRSMSVTGDFAKVQK